MTLALVIFFGLFIGNPLAVGVYAAYDYVCESKKTGSWRP